MNAKKTKIKPRISVVLKESPLLSVKKEESKEGGLQGKLSVSPFSVGEPGSGLQDKRKSTPITTIQSEREFANADENIAEETKHEEHESNPFGEPVTS